MNMKYNKIYLLFICLLGIILSSCRKEEAVVSQEINGEESWFSIYANAPRWDENTSTRGGVLDPGGEVIRTIQLLCFDDNGLFVGRREADFTEIESGAVIRGKLTALIPSVTCRIHFVANGNFSNFDDKQNIGIHENTLIPSLAGSTGVMVYWGYKRCQTPGDLFGGGELTLYRNQVLISFEIDESLEYAGNAVCNHYAYGTVAPFDRNDLDNPFGYNSGSRFITLPDTDRQILADDPIDVKTEHENYIFENPNIEDQPVSVIFKIRHYDSGDRLGGNSRELYHKILLIDKDYNLLPLYRNHRYHINIKSLPANTGYTTFEEARQGVAANNPFISIEDLLPGISTGKYSLTIPDGTTRIFQNPGVQTIRFIYKGDGVSANDLNISWVENDGFASPGCRISSYNPGTGEGEVEITLNALRDNPQYGKLRIQANELVRNIKIISIRSFEFDPVRLTSGINDADGQEVVLTFDIPETYPRELFPVECKIACDRFDASPKNKLKVIVEELEYEGQAVEGVYKKFVFIAETPGCHRVYLKTIGSGYNGTKNTTLYLEAENFRTVKEDFEFTTSGGALILGDVYDSQGIGYTTDDTHVERYAVQGNQFTINYRNAAATTGKTVNVYTENCELTEGSKVGEGHYRFTTAAHTGNETLTFRSLETSFDEIIWFEFEDKSCRSSSIRVSDKQGLAFGLSIPEQPVYRYGEPVTLNFTIPADAVAGGGFECTIRTRNLTAAAGQGLTALPAGNGYSLQITAAGNYALEFTTNRMISKETVTIYSDDSVDIPTERVTYENTPVAGTISLDEGSFGPEPFVYIEDKNGIRIGVITINESSTRYELRFRPEYYIYEETELTFVYNNAGNVYEHYSDIKTLLDDGDIVLSKR